MAGRSGSGRADARLADLIDRRGASSPAPARRSAAPHVAHEANAFALEGADQLLALAGVAERLACCIDAAGEGRFRHDPAVPDRGDEIVLGDDAIAVLDQANQQVEHLRLDGDRLGGATQLAPVGVKRMIGKDKPHVLPPVPDCPAPL